jgi:topoisomerase-4 subunit A
MIDADAYNDGKRGGKIKCRAHIEEVDKKTIRITDVPYGVTTTQLMDSIVKANDQGKIKIKKVTDNTAAEVEISVELAPGISPDITIDALYAFTDCEVSISPNTCVILENKPVFLGASDLLRISTDHTRELLQQELEIKLRELEDKWHYTSLEKIFFEEKIYKELEKRYATWDRVIEAITEAFQPFLKRMKREITREDVLKLTEKPVRRIYKLDIDQLNDQIRALETEIKQTKHHLAHLTDYAIAYFEELLRKYGKGRERKTEIKPFDVIEAKHVAIANTKIYVNRAEGFVGTSLKKDEFVADCSDLDDIIVFTRRGIMKIVKVGEKVYIGKDIIHIALFQKNDERMTYNMIYSDGATGVTYAKRFNVTGITRDKEYDLTKGADKSKVLYFTANPNGEAEVVSVILSPNCPARNKIFEFYFEEMEIKGRNAAGNQVTKYAVKNVKLKEKGRSTLSGRKLWFDEQFGRLNTEEKGSYLGSFDPEDKLLVVYHDGQYEVTETELARRFDPENVVKIEKFDSEKVITVVYLDNDKQQFNVKRFRVETQTLNSKFYCIREGEANYLAAVSTHPEPVLLIKSGRGTSQRTSKIKISNLVEVMGWRAVGNKLTDFSKTTEFEWVHKPEKNDLQAELF